MSFKIAGVTVIDADRKLVNLSGTDQTTKDNIGGGGGFSSINRVVFTESGTYTPSAGLISARVVVTGAGGGAEQATVGYGAGGGAGGSTVIATLTPTQIGSSAVVSIGASDPRGSGGSSYFVGDLVNLLASGGLAGNTYGYGGIPVPDSIEGAENLLGGRGGNGIKGATVAMGGNGGSSYWGGGGRGLQSSSNPAPYGGSPDAYGAGWGGGADFNGGMSFSFIQPPYKGGIVVIEEYLG